MKKTIFMLILTLTVLMTACNPTENDKECTLPEVLVDGECVDESNIGDTTAPVLSGVADLEVIYGEVFDNMLGVSAVDDTDGDVTSNIAVSGTVDVNSSGIYVITYTVTDAANNQVTESRTITVAQRIYESSVWNGFFMEVSVNETISTITYPATPAVWWESNAQYMIDDFDGTQEAIAFTFTGELDHEYLFKIEGGGNATELSVMGTGVEQVVVLNLIQFTEAQREEFNLLVLFVKTEGASGSIALDPWVYSVFVDSTAPVINGAYDFQIEIGSTFDNMIGVTANDDIDGDLTDSIIVSGTVDVNTLGTYVVTYSVSDDANNEETISRTITVVDEIVVGAGWTGYDMVVVEDGNNVSITYEGITTDGWFNKSAQYAYTEFNENVEQVIITFTGEADQMYFFKLEGLGGISQIGMTANGELQQIALSLEDLDAAARLQIDKLVVFAQTGGASGTIVISNIQYILGEPVVYDVWSGYGMEVSVDGDLTTITYPATPATWWDSNAQYRISDFDGTKDVIEFTFTGELDHEYLFKIEGGGIATELAVLGTGVEQTLIIPLNQFTEAQREGFNLLVLFVKTEDATGSIVLSNWSYPDIELPLWNVYGGIELTENVSSYTLTYSSTPTNWWEDSAQQPLDSFDGTKTAIIFGFTGEAGHLYLFKIEGGGVSAELAVTGTGSYQELTLPLDSLSEAERNELNLIVWFCQTVGASGSIEIDGWEYSTE